jgi:SRSO17 transposase
VFGPATTTFAEMIAIAGRRWKIEDALEGAKVEVGLDHYEVRCWQSWYRHVTLALLAHAYLTVMRAKIEERGQPEADGCVNC